MAVFRDAGGPTALQYRVGCMELDLGFTPATNLLPLRRLNLGVGQMAEVRSAWIEWPAADLRPLVQQYRRESVTSYRYEAQLPGGDVFSTVLRVDPFGWVVEYGGLWQAVPSSLPEEADQCHRAH